MYIYELPFEIHNELCRLLDSYDYWEELAGNHMKYSAMDVVEIKQTAKRNGASPTSHLLLKWGQLNHNVDELYILLYRMKYVLALRCLSSVVSSKFLGLLSKLEKSNSGKSKSSSNDKFNKQVTQKADGSHSSILLPVMLYEQQGLLPTSSHGRNGTTPTIESSTYNSSTTGSGNYTNDEIMKNVLAIPKMSYEELKAATDNWNEANLLGRGGFGQVFQGVWKHLPVAVKRLKENEGENKELIREMCLNQYRHDNILPLYGYSYGGPEMCLVYQLMPGGTLEQRLRGRTQHPPLSWPQRYRIAHGVARGLQFLHTMAGTPLIHGDIKPANILLDQCLMPKIGDFGLARKGPYGEDRTHVKVSRVYGTRPYLPLEYLHSKCLSPAVDVFSYGVVMFEMATALLVFDKSRPPHVHTLAAYMRDLHRDGVDFATFEDPVLRDTTNSNPQLCRDFASIAINCTKHARHERPTMLEVYKQLDAMDLPGKHLI